MPAKNPDLMTPAEVALVFRVDPKTVTRWAKDGRLTAVKTLGGHRRYATAEVHQLLSGDTASPGAVLTPAEVYESIADEESIHYLTEEEVRLALHFLAGRHPDATAKAVSRRLSDRTAPAELAS